MAYSRVAAVLADRLAAFRLPLANRLTARPIFVVGFNKSAKSMIVDGLARMPGLSVYPGEGNGNLWFKGFYPWPTAAGHPRPLWADPDGFVAAVMESGAGRYDRSRAQLGLYRLFRCPRDRLLVDSGMLAAVLPEVLQSLPEAQVVHVIRDGRAVCRIAQQKTLKRIRANPAAYAQSGCRTDPAAVLGAQAKYWCWTLDRVAQVEAASPDSVLRVRYEDWCADPRRELVSIARFLGLPTTVDDRLPWLELSNRNPEVIGAMSERESRTVSEIQRKHLARYGYGVDCAGSGEHETN